MNTDKVSEYFVMMQYWQLSSSVHSTGSRWGGVGVMPWCFLEYLGAALALPLKIMM
jgi:hypothetical protein